jgi:hypothetical protein
LWNLIIYSSCTMVSLKKKFDKKGFQLNVLLFRNFSPHFAARVLPGVRSLLIIYRLGRDQHHDQRHGTNLLLTECCEHSMKLFSPHIIILA